MLTVYLDEQSVIASGKRFVKFNDAFFNKTYKDKSIHEQDKIVMKYIDEVDYAEDYRIKSKYEPGICIRMTELSTGCKTALNILNNPNIIFFGGECGENALDKILTFKDGSVFINYFILPSRFINNIELVYKGQRIIIRNNTEFEREIGKVLS